jgi:hypothetical protein
MNNLEIELARELTMKQITSILDLTLCPPGDNEEIVVDLDKLTQDLCDVVCENFPKK